ncbi:MAG: tRNA (adenosine(37)-N6)-threonylcarbamoyltransferase complex dimerization subunit type 1 TsaB [Clostridia bacterium]
MKILAIDSVAENLVVAVSDGEKLYSKVSTTGSKTHNSLLLPYIDEALGEAGLEIGDIDCFGCVVGAGSFTGIRIGVSTMKALCFATGKKCVALTSFQEVAYNIEEENFVVAIDCRHDSFYCAQFAQNWENIIQMREYTAEELTKFDCNIYYKKGASSPQKLVEMTQILATKNEFGQLEPLYLKKSQAEREKDGD